MFVALGTHRLALQRVKDKASPKEIKRPTYFFVYFLFLKGRYISHYIVTLELLFNHGDTLEVFDSWNLPQIAAKTLCFAHSTHFCTEHAFKLYMQAAKLAKLLD